MSEDSVGAGVEMVDVVDDDDHVVATVTRATMRAERLQHRGVSIAVMSSDGRLLVHRRAAHKDIWPGWLDIAAGGVVSAGESYDVAAGRELAEEMGVADVPLQPLGGGRFVDHSVALIGRGYLAVTDGPFVFADGEVDKAWFVTRAELDELLANESFVPDNLALLLPFLDF